MYVRAIAMALPLVLGTACKTTEARSSRSAQTASTATGQTDHNVTTSEPKTAAESNTSPSDTPSADDTAATRSGQTDHNVTTSEPKTAGESDMSPTAPDDTTTAQGDTSSSSSSSSDEVLKDPIMAPGDSVQAHADDNVVSGTIARVSRRSLVISSDSGEQKTLFLAPETSIEVDGQDAQRGDLQQGQDVRASFNEVNGRNIAVKVRAGEGAASTSGSSGAAGGNTATESGSDETSPSRGPGGTGTPQEPGNTSSTPSSGNTSSDGVHPQGY